MKAQRIIPLVLLACLLALLAALVSGCNTITYRQVTLDAVGRTNTVISLSVTRFFWDSNYEAVMNAGGGGTLKATKSNVDAAAILAVGQVAMEGAKAGAMMAKQPEPVIGYGYVVPNIPQNTWRYADQTNWTGQHGLTRTNINGIEVWINEL